VREGSVRRNLRGLAQALVVLLSVSAISSTLAIGDRSLASVANLAFVPLMVLFLVWFCRARLNAAWPDWPQRRTPGWAVGAWFAPVVFLWFPYQIRADIWRGGLAVRQPGEEGSVVIGLADPAGAWPG
jgi:hypothetical protein